MLTSNLNWIDYCILGVFCMSILAGLMRGLVKEVIAVVTWIAAFIIAGLFADRLAALFTQSPVVQSTLQSASSTMGFNATHSVNMVAVGISFIAIFVGALMVGGILNYFISSALEAAGISLANRLLGGLFGLFRGFLITVIIIFIVQLSPLGQQAAWVQSQFVKSFQPAISLIYRWIQPNADQFRSTVGTQLQAIKPTVPTFNAQ